VSELTDDHRALLSERRYAVLATHDPEGTIHQTPVWFLFEDDRFYIESYSASRKVENLRHRATASITVDVRQPGMDRWVSASGTTDILSGDEAEAINASIVRRYLTREAIDDARIGPVFAASDDVTIRLFRHDGGRGRHEISASASSAASSARPPSAGSCRSPHSSRQPGARPQTNQVVRGQ
jgi:PPOX class probable F420-dependent enzyme